MEDSKLAWTSSKQIVVVKKNKENQGKNETDNISSNKDK